MIPRKDFDLASNARLVTRALHQLDIPAHVNARNDIVVDSFKVSGSAYRIIQSRAFHHGTMLIDADLKSLRGVLSADNVSGDHHQ
jgi:lipoate-protein ligase A